MLDRFQKFTLKQLSNGQSTAANNLSSLSNEYSTASSDYDAQLSIYNSANGDLFAPNQQNTLTSANNQLKEDRQCMAHDQALAPQWQRSYQQYQTKIQDLKNAGSNGYTLGASLAENTKTYHSLNSSQSDQSNDANSDATASNPLDSDGFR